MRIQVSAGFTLLETIVVALIIAVLAGVGIPMYNGYIRQARQDNVTTLAKSVATLAHSYYRKTSNLPANLTVLNFRYDTTRYAIVLSVTTPDTAVIVTDTTGSTDITDTVSYK